MDDGLAGAGGGRMKPSARQGGFTTVARLILASASPRRRSLLKMLGLEFEVEAAAVDESPRPGETPAHFVRRLAAEKGAAIAGQEPDAAVLAADTVVVVDGDLLGKPRDEVEAVEMLKRLSGRAHEVWTGFSLQQGTGLLSQRAICTQVQFIDLTEALCRAYVRTGEPLDKAGAYGIQGQGGFLVEKISGSYSNVVGLPLAEVVTDLLRFHLIAPRS